MKLLPSDYIEFKSDLSLSEIETVLKNNTTSKEILNFEWGKPNRALFEGVIKKESFEIQRNIKYRNSFLPQMFGTLKKSSGKIKVQVKIQLLSIVYYSVLLFIGLAVSILAMTIYFMGFSKPEVIFSSLGFILFIIVLTWIGYSYEKSKSINDLKRILRSKNV